MRDVCERPAMHHRRRAFGGLHQVRQQRFVQQRHHRSGCVQVCCAYWITLAVLPDHDPRQAGAQVLTASSKRQDGHDLRSRRNEEAAGTIAAIALLLVRARYADGDVAQRAVVHVERARPCDAVRIEVKFIAMEHVRIYRGPPEGCGRR